jgi:putative nucleotidyltransferase with HDIG domain
VIIIERQNLLEIKNWFSQYVRLFKHGDETDLRAIDLKEQHTFRVCEEILNIGKKLGLNDNELRLAEMIALLHDIGRFEQYALYKTFSDRQSVNHATAGTAIVKKYNVLKGFDGFTERLILRTIECHNRASLPHDEEEPNLFFIKLLRDADKLDIWRVVTDYYHRKERIRNRTIDLDLPDTAGISTDVYQDIMNKHIVDINHINNLNDYKVLQMGWIFDINYKPTLHCIKKRRYLELIRDVLPDNTDIRTIHDIVQKHCTRLLTSEIP